MVGISEKFAHIARTFQHFIHEFKRDENNYCETVSVQWQRYE